MNDKPVYWAPFPVSEEFGAYLEGCAHTPRSEHVDENYRTDLGKTLAAIPVSEEWYCFGRARSGEARSIASRASRKTYGHLRVARIDAPSWNEHRENGDYYDHQLMFARRLR